ncbi:MAG: nucleotide exchange factor GrpE [Proteobacteria bacterium]|nr:nucleotide exchange factor GrpE [Pseudomonadota bacterium]
MDENKNNTLSEIDILKAQITDLDNNWKRALADYKNLVERTNKEKKDFYEFANASLLTSLMPVYDSLEMLAKFNQDQGLQLTVKQFKQILSEEGLKEIETIGRDYNVNEMEAVEMVEGEEGKVIEELSKGFYFKGKLLRPARVKVGKGN